jgi:hypothetical protein
MATLASLKLVTAKKPTQQPPVVHRRNKLSAKVFEQLQLARAQNDGTVFAPTRTKTVTNTEGNRVQITQPNVSKRGGSLQKTASAALLFDTAAKCLSLLRAKLLLKLQVVLH